MEYILKNEDEKECEATKNKEESKETSTNLNKDDIDIPLQPLTKKQLENQKNCKKYRDKKKFNYLEKIRVLKDIRQKNQEQEEELQKLEREFSRLKVIFSEANQNPPKKLSIEKFIRFPTYEWQKEVSNNVLKIYSTTFHGFPIEKKKFDPNFAKPVLAYNEIDGKENSKFRALSLIITGSQSHYEKLEKAVQEHVKKFTVFQVKIKLLFLKFIVFFYVEPRRNGAKSSS